MWFVGEVITFTSLGDASMTERALVYHQHRRLTRTASRRLLAGVCSGLARFTGLNRWVIRAIAVGATIGTGGLAIFAYMLAAFIIPEDTMPNPRKDVDNHALRRSRQDRLLSGVCGGIAGYLGIDAAAVRLLWALATLGSFGLGLVAYLGLTVIIPKVPLSTAASLGAPLDL